MATEVEQLYLQLELINIEEQMLKLQMLKRRRQRRHLRGWSVRPAEAERMNLQHWMNKFTFDNFECQRASSPYTAIKTGEGNCRKFQVLLNDAAFIIFSQF